MQEFFDIARSDFVEAFGDAWIFPLLTAAILWILCFEKNRIYKYLFGVMPVIFLVIYWCPVTGRLFMEVLSEDIYWRILWLIPIAMIIPYAGCILCYRLKGVRRQGLFLLLMLLVVICGKNVLSEENFEPSLNAYKIPQNVIEVCDLLPENIHAMVSNRLIPYIRMYDPSITLQFGRTALIYNGMDEKDADPRQRLYLEAQKTEIDLSVLAPLAKEEKVTFLVFSNNRTYIGKWEDYGYKEYGSTEEFCIFVDEDYEEGQDTRKWEG